MKCLTNRIFGVSAALGTFLVLMTMGCSQSPVVGTWKGTATGAAANIAANRGGQRTINSTLTLNADGTGRAKLAIIPEQPITWTQKDGTVTVTLSDKRTSVRGSRNVIGTLSENKRSMGVYIGMGMSLTLTKK
jgi:hypothetical protein